MIRFGKTVVGAVIVSTMVSGCMSMNMVNGRPFALTDGFTVVTTPVGATATSEYGDSCTTPCRLPLPIDRGGEVTIALDGYTTETIYVGTHTDHGRQVASSALDVIDPDPVDLGIDAFFSLFNRNGLHRSLDADSVEITLIPFTDPGDAQDTDLASNQISVGESGDAVVYRLTEEEIAEIRRSQ